MSTESSKNIYLIRHFEREDLKDEAKFNLELSAIDDINLRKIASINPALHDNLYRFEDFTHIYKFPEREKYCDDAELLCSEFIKYEKLVIEHIEKIVNIRQVPRMIRFGPHQGDIKMDIVKETNIVTKYFNSEECEIWSSPFLRCLQTAIFIAKLLGVSYINVHYGLSEICDPDVLGSYWNDLRISGSVNINKIYENSMSRLTHIFPIAQLINDVYTEINDTNNINYNKRIDDTIRDIYDRNKSSSKSKIFIISHADLIKQFNIIPDGKGMDYFERYDITDKVKEMTGGNYYIYMKKTHKYEDKINKLLSRILPFQNTILHNNGS